MLEPDPHGTGAPMTILLDPIPIRIGKPGTLLLEPLPTGTAYPGDGSCWTHDRPSGSETQGDLSTLDNPAGTVAHGDGVPRILAVQEPVHHGAPTTSLLEPIPTCTQDPGHDWSDRPAEPVPRGDGGTQEIHLVTASRWNQLTVNVGSAGTVFSLHQYTLNQASGEEASPTGTDPTGQRTLCGHDTDSSANRMYLDQSQTQPESTKIVTVGTESSPWGPSPLGIELTMDTSPSGAGSPQNRCATDIPDGFPEGSHSGTPWGSGSPGNPGLMDIDTDDCSSLNRTPATQGSAGQPALTGTQPLVAMATSLAQTRQNSGPFQCVFEWKHSLVFEYIYQCFYDAITVQCGVALYWHGYAMETRRHRMILFRQDCHRCGRTISTSCNLRSLYPWVSKFLLQHWYRHHNHLFSSQQHRLQLRVSKPRMLSWWLRPCGRWCHPWFNSNNAWVPFQEGQELQEWDVHRQQLLQCYRLGYLGLMLHQGFFPISDDQCSYKDTIDTSYREIYSTDWNTRMCPFAALGCSAFIAHSRSPVDHHPSVVTLDPPRRHRLQVSRRTRKKFWRETMKFFVRRCAVLWHRSIPALITLMIRIRRLDPWFPQMMCTRTKSLGSYSLLWKVLSGTVPILLREWITQMIAQRPHFVIHLHHRTPSLSSHTT